MMFIQFPRTVLQLLSNIGARFLPVSLVRLTARGCTPKPAKQVYKPRATKTAPISKFRSRLVTVFGTWQNHLVVYCLWVLIGWAPGSCSEDAENCSSCYKMAEFAEKSRVGRGAWECWPAPNAQHPLAKSVPSSQRPRASWVSPGRHIPWSPTWPILPRFEPRTGLACSRNALSRASHGVQYRVCLLACICAQR